MSEKFRTDLILNFHPRDCPGWEYREFDGNEKILKSGWERTLRSLRKKQLCALQTMKDSRKLHENLFKDLTPSDHGYFAGHYRGEPFRCLRCYRVCVPADSRVGHEPPIVDKSMVEFSEVIQAIFNAIDAGNKTIVSKKQKIVFAVKAVCRLFVKFLEIHPYANGNGHIARIFIWAFLSNFNIWPTRLPVEPGPTGYGRHIADYRSGKTTPLELFVLGCI